MEAAFCCIHMNANLYLRLGEAILESYRFVFEIASGADIIKSNAILQPQ